MAAEEFTDVVASLSERDDMRFLDGATEEQVEHFEASNSIQLPSQLKGWLLFSDGGDLYLPAGIQLYGVAHKPLIDVGSNDKPSEGFTVIGALSNGDPLVCEKDSERISIFNLEAGRVEEDEAYPDFLAFLKSLKDILGIED